MIIIIGAGIAGLSLANELLIRGAEVTVLEAKTVACGASGVATSYLEPRPGNTPLRKVEWDALRRWPGYAAKLQSASGIPVEFHDDGGLRVTLEENLTRFKRELKLRQKPKWNIDPISPQVLHRLEPSLSEKIVAGADFNDVCRVNGRAVCMALALTIRSLGGKVLEYWQVRDCQVNRHAIMVTSRDGRRLAGDKLVLCTGAGDNTIPGLPEDVPRTRPVRGVNLVVDQSGLAHPVSRLIKHHRGNFCPRGNGQLIVGTTYEPGETSLKPDNTVIEKLYANAEPILPMVRDLPLVTVTAGIRAKVGDGLLRLGRSSLQPGVFFSLSHAGAGFLRAPVVADEFAGFVLSGTKGRFTHPVTTG